MKQKRSEIGIGQRHILAKSIRNVRKVAESSVRTYVCNIIHLFSVSGCGKWDDDCLWAMNPVILEHLQKLEENHGEPRKRCKLLMSVFLCLDICLYNKTETIPECERLRKIYYELFQRSKKELDDFLFSGELTARQKENVVSWKTILRVCRDLDWRAQRKKLYEMTKENFTRQFLELQRSVALHCFTKMDPLRLDLADCKVVSQAEYKEKYKHDSSLNFLVTGKRYVFYFKKYKTKKKYGDVCIYPPLKLKKILKKYVKVIRSVFGSEPWFFVNSSFQKLSRTGLTKMLTATFQKEIGKSISSQLLRTIYVSTHCSHEQNLKRKKMAKNMMHGTGTASKCYIKSIDCFVE